MNRRREALRRLGLKLCNNCGSTRDVCRYRGDLTCYVCIEAVAQQEELAHQKKMAELQGQLANQQSDRASNTSYRQACAEMAAGMGEVFGYWWEK